MTLTTKYYFEKLKKKRHEDRLEYMEKGREEVFDEMKRQGIDTATIDAIRVSVHAKNFPENPKVVEHKYRDDTLPVLAAQTLLNAIMSGDVSTENMLREIGYRFKSQYAVKGVAAEGNPRYSRMLSREDIGAIPWSKIPKVMLFQQGQIKTITLESSWQAYEPADLDILVKEKGSL